MEKKRLLYVTADRVVHSVMLMLLSSSEGFPNCVTMGMMSVARACLKENNPTARVRPDREIVEPGPRYYSVPTHMRTNWAHRKNTLIAVV